MLFHPSAPELIMAAFVAASALLVLACDLLPSPRQRDTDESGGTNEADDRDDVRQPDQPTEMAAAA